MDEIPPFRSARTNVPERDEKRAIWQPEAGLYEPKFLAGRYELAEMIGSGGTAQVFLAYDLLLHREPVAIKLILSTLGSTLQCRPRLFNEVRLARRLTHPHIVQIHDFGDAGENQFYMSMELVKGSDLSSTLGDYPRYQLPEEKALQYLFQIAVAIDYAHRLGVIHRDIKPSNILLFKKRLAKLTDFGSARVLQVDPSITPAGELIGTPHYIAPELLRGEQPDARVDIYSLGILAFEILTGDVPFDDDRIVSLIAMHLNHPIPNLSKFRPTLSTWWQDLIEVCCEKSAHNRFQTAEEFAREVWLRMMALGIKPDAMVIPPGLGERSVRSSWKTLFGAR